MATEAAAPATTPAASPAAAAEPDVPRNADGTVDITAFAAMAQAELAREADEGAAAELAAAEPADKAKDKGRDPKTGKFAKPADSKEPEQAAKDESEQATEEQAEDTGATRGPRLHRLWKEGKLAEWFKASTGLDVDDPALARIPSKALARARHDLSEANRVRTAAQQEAARVVNYFRPVEEACKRRDSGDVRGAVEAFFGKKLEDVQADIVASYHKTDPAVEATRRELQELRQQLQAERQQSQQQAQQQSLAQAQAQERKTLVSYLQSSDDARIARVASKPKFVEAVIQAVKDNYDQTLGISIPWSEAAEMAYADLYEGVIDSEPPARTREKSTPGVVNPANSARGRSHVRSLDPKRSAEAAPPDMPEPGTREMAQYWARQARLAMAKG